MFDIFGVYGIVYVSMFLMHPVDLDWFSHCHNSPASPGRRACKVHHLGSCGSQDTGFNPSQWFPETGFCHVLPTLSQLPNCLA